LEFDADCMTVDRNSVLHADKAIHIIFVWLLIKGTVQLGILKELHLLLYTDNKDYSTVPKYQKHHILRNRGTVVAFKSVWLG
jgi:hypothetical protein